MDIMLTANDVKIIMIFFLGVICGYLIFIFEYLIGERSVIEGSIDKI